MSSAKKPAGGGGAKAAAALRAGGGGGAAGGRTPVPVPSPKARSGPTSSSSAAAAASSRRAPPVPLPLPLHADSDVDSGSESSDADDGSDSGRRMGVSVERQLPSGSGGASSDDEPMSPGDARGDSDGDDDDDDDDDDPLEPRQVGGVPVAAVAAGMVAAPSFPSAAATVSGAGSSSNISAGGGGKDARVTRALPAALGEDEALGIVLESSGITREEHAKAPQGPRGAFLEVFQINRYRRIQGLSSFGSAVRHLEIMHQSQLPGTCPQHCAQCNPRAAAPRLPNCCSEGSRRSLTLSLPFPHPLPPFRFLACCAVSFDCRHRRDRRTAGPRQPRDVSPLHRAARFSCLASSVRFADSVAHAAF